MRVLNQKKVRIYDSIKKCSKIMKFGRNNINYLTFFI